MDAYQKIKSDVKKRNFVPIYFLMGEEPFFIDQISQLIIKTVLPENQKDFNQNILYGKDTSVDEIISTCKRFPMMAGHQLVIVREAQDLSRSIEKFENYASQPQPTTILVICYKNKNLDKRKKLYKSILKVGLVLETKKLYDNKFPLWIENQVEEQGRKINFKATAILSESVGANLGTLYNQINKLCLIVDREGEINTDHIEQHVGISKEYNNFELRKALGSGNIVKAYTIADFFGSFPKKHPLLVTIKSLHNFYLQLLTYHSLSSKNQVNVAKTLGIHPYFISEIEIAARRYPLKSIVPILKIIKNADLAVKGVNCIPISERQILQELLVKIA